MDLGLPLIWAAEIGKYDQNMVEFALSHQLPTRSQAAYFRSDLFEKRKILMKIGRFCHIKNIIIGFIERF